MSDTDTTLAMTAHSPRPSALGDLRFAGTIAAGLVAGTLGLGALAAPLVGWKDWPSGLEKDAAAEPMRLASPSQPSGGARENGGGNGGSQQPGPGGATPLSVSIPGPGGTGGPLPLLPIGGPTNSTSSAGDDGGRSTTATPRSGTGQFTGAGFKPVDTTDTDGDNMPNDYERTVTGTNAGDASDGSATNGYGVTNSAEFRIKANLPAWDTNGNGVLDGEDDSDGDGVLNGVEERNGSDPASNDSDNDGIPDGMDDRDGDGYPDGIPVPTTPVEEPPVEEPPVVEEPEQTPAPAPEETPVPPAEEAPAPPADTTPTETPASGTARSPRLRSSPSPRHHV